MTTTVTPAAAREPPPLATSTCVAAAAVVGTLAFAVYARTLLPGVDLGDTGGFQAAAVWPETSARRAYPLYYLLAKPFVQAVGAANPARALNLFSAVCGGAAVALLTFLLASITRSLMAAAAGGVLLAFSLTFWSQAVIAEVYTLHLTLIAACLIALHTCARSPTRTRLATFFLIYACAFGNHLSMILLLVPFALFLLQTHPAPRTLVGWPVVALAAGSALAGALLYLPEMLSVWTHIDAPSGATDRLAAFWFDTTKADWRESMVLRVNAGEWRDRLAMWAWDLRLQFGAVGIVVAAAGVVRVWRTARPWAVLIVTAYVISTGFALTYNVGDPPVFLLPGHLLTSLAAGAALALPRGATSNRRWLTARVVSALAVIVILHAAWRAMETWPVADRSGDRRAEALINRLTAGIDDSTAVLVSQMDWQTEDALLYASRVDRRDLAWTRLSDVLLHFPAFVRDNHTIGRDIVLTRRAAEAVASAYGPMFPILPDEIPPAPSLSETVAGIPRGTPYVLTLLTPQDAPLDRDDFARSFEILTTRPPADLTPRYQVWAGVAGEPHLYHRAAERPFHDDISLLGDPLRIRMDGWLPVETFRRGGFGHVTRGRAPVLIVERGVSFAYFGSDGTARMVYAAGLYAPAARFRIPAAAAQQVARISVRDR